MTNKMDLEKYQDELNRQIEEKKGYWQAQKRKLEFRQKFYDVIRTLIHPVIMTLHGQWRGNNKHPDGRQVHLHRNPDTPLFLHKSYEYQKCGRNGVFFILTFTIDDEAEQIVIYRDYFKEMYNREKYIREKHELMNSEDRFSLEKVNQEFVKKQVTKGVWQARKIDLVEYFGPSYGRY
jgi:hypothetical protein